MADVTAHPGDTRENGDTGDTILTFGRLGIGSLGRRSAGWLGMMTLILTEAFLFGYLLFSYFFMAFHDGRDWLPAELPTFYLSGPNTILLLLSSVVVWLGERSVRRERRIAGAAFLAGGLVMGAAFVAVQWIEWSEKPFRLDSNSYGSLFFVITGFHMAHVVAGLLILAALSGWTAMGLFDRSRHAHVSIGVIYWHFVDAVWLAVFFTLYITPYFMA